MMMTPPAVVLLLTVMVGAAEARWPAFSWQTVPVFAHTCNVSGPLSTAAVETLARFPMVTIEKAQSLYAAPEYVSAESKIIAELLRVKAVNPAVSAVIYYNSVLDWPWYDLHESLENASAAGKEVWVRDADGSYCTIQGDSSFPNSSDLRVLDMASATTSELWTTSCLAAAEAGLDGCFSDRATGSPNCPVTEAYHEGHFRTQDELQTRLGPDKLLIANEACELDPRRDDDSGDVLRVAGAMLEFFDNSEASILALRSCAQTYLVQAHYEPDDPAVCDDPVDALAAFLVAATNTTYFACSTGWTTADDPVVWRDWYDKPLGPPLADAVKTADLWTRSFASGTRVAFNVTDNTGRIDWFQPPRLPEPAGHRRNPTSFARVWPLFAARQISDHIHQIRRSKHARPLLDAAQDYLQGPSRQRHSSTRTRTNAAP